MKRFQLLLVSAIMALSVFSQSVVAYEYWFDQLDAIGLRVNVPVSATTTLNLTNLTFDHPSLSPGLHQIHLRLKDSNGAWSSVVSRHFVNGPGSPYQITAVRYWWSDLANPPLGSDMRYKYFDTPQTTLTYNGWLELCGYPTGSQTLKLQLLDNHGQWSSVMTKPVTVNATGTLGVPQITASQSTFCPGDVVTFTAASQTGAGFATATGYSWQVPTGNGWSAQPSSGSTIVVTIGSSSGAMQAAATNYCGAGSLGSFQVNIPSAPDQPVVITGPLQACIGSAAVFTTPQVTGVTYEWVISGGWGGNGGPGNSIPTTIGASNATISVTPFNSCGVPGPVRTETIVVTAPPYAGADGTLTICSNGWVTALFGQLQGTPDTGGVWRRNGVPVSGIYDPATDSPGVYTYTVAGIGPCPDASANVVVTEPQLPNAGTDGSIALCSNAQPMVMTALLGGVPDDNGSWSGPSPTNGFYDPATMSPGVYTYTVPGTAPCPNASATLTITETQAPNAGVGGLVERCMGSAPFVLFGVLTGSPDFGGMWSNQAGATSGIFDPGTSTEGVYTYTVLGAGPCATATAQLEVNVMELQLDTIMGPDTISMPGTYIFSAEPFLTDADSIVWSFPAGWDWGNDLDHFDGAAYLDPPEQAGVYTVCATAYGGGCAGSIACSEISTGVAMYGSGADGVVVYPNPNNGRFTVRSPVASDQMTFRLVNSIGQELAEFGIGTGTVNVDLEDLAAGMYTLRWTSRSGTGTRTVIVVH